MRYRLLLALAIAGIAACSGNPPDDASADSGAAGNAGGVAQGGAAANASGGALVASAGGPQGNAGLAGAAGSAASAAGAAGDSSGTASCPVWPRTRLLPLIGPFFYGPDPGPCKDSTGTTFSYEAGRLLSSTDMRQVKTSYQYDAQGLLKDSTSSDGTSETFEFGANYVLDTFKSVDGSITAQYRYTLSASGYPTTISIEFPGSPPRFGSYSYSNCRLLERTADLGGPVPEKLSYEYDDAGHLTKRVCDCNHAATFDYSCWN